MRRVFHVWVDRLDSIEAGLVLIQALLLSNGIRRDARVLLDGFYRGVETRLEVDGRRVKHLRPDYDSLRGFLKRALTGGMPGVRVLKPRVVLHELCLVLEPRGAGFQRLLDAVCSMLGEDVTIVYGEPMASCKRSVVVEAPLLAPWGLIGVVNVAIDWCLHGWV